MTEFAQLVSGWQWFYQGLCEADATLAGLLFVSLTFNSSIMQDSKNDYLQRLAEQTLSNYISLIIISLLFLVPNQIPVGIGIPLFAISVYSALHAVHLLWQQHIHPDNTRYIYRRLAISAGSYGILGLSALLLLHGDSFTLYWLAAIMIALLSSTCWDAWFLLRTVPRSARRE